MSVQISEIKDTRLQAIAQQVDDGDGVLKKKEYTLFAQEASKQGVDAKAIGDALDMNGMQRWWYDVDKVSSDGKDDGKLSFGEGAKSFGKGLLGGLAKTIAKNPLESTISIGAFAGALAIIGAVASAPVAATVGVVAGVGFGAAALVKGIKQTKNAKTDGEAKMGLENAGTGASMVALSGLGIRSAKAKAVEVRQKANLSKEVKGFNEGRKVIDQTYNEDGFIIEERAHYDHQGTPTKFPEYDPAYKVRTRWNDNGSIETEKTLLVRDELCIEKEKLVPYEIKTENGNIISGYDRSSRFETVPYIKNK